MVAEFKTHLDYFAVETEKDCVSSSMLRAEESAGSLIEDEDAGVGL